MLRAIQKLLSPSAEIFKELCKLGHILFSGTLYRLRSVLLRLGILRLNGLRILCLAVLGLRLLLGRSLLELGIILRLSILTLCGLSILLPANTGAEQSGRTEAERAAGTEED